MRPLRRPLSAVSVLVVVAVAVYLQRSDRPDAVAGAAPASNASTDKSLSAAARDHAEGLEVNVHGRVTRLLSDDTKGARHQRFLIRTGENLSILVVHNIDLAPRVPVRQGDSVALRGEYVWNDRGGMVHWTHHDPDRRHQAGWIELGGRRYD